MSFQIPEEMITRWWRKGVLGCCYPTSVRVARKRDDIGYAMSCWHRRRVDTIDGRLWGPELADDAREAGILGACLTGVVPV
jgi:hypothetical protein